MKIEIDLSEKVLINLIKTDYENDVDFIYEAADEALTQYDKTVKLIKKLVDSLPAGFRIEVKEYINEKHEKTNNT